MVAAPHFRGGLKILDKKLGGGGRPEQKIEFGGGATFKGGPKILGGGL